MKRENHFRFTDTVTYGVYANKEGAKTRMQEVHLPIKKYQTITIIAAVVGFLLGTLIPAFAFGKGYWSCPFGQGVIRVGVFVLLIGILSSLLAGNAAALLVILIAKLHRLSSKPK